jgi:hypothetical protein
MSAFDDLLRMVEAKLGCARRGASSHQAEGVFSGNVEFDGGLNGWIWRRVLWMGLVNLFEAWNGPDMEEEGW